MWIPRQFLVFLPLSSSTAKHGAYLEALTLVIRARQVDDIACSQLSVGVPDAAPI